MLRILFMTLSCLFIILAEPNVLSALSCSNPKNSDKVSGSSVAPSAWEQKIAELNRKITELKKMQRGHESKAARYVNQAQRLQFIQSEQLTAKRFWELAEENKQISEHIQKDINELETQKKSILDKHNVKPAVKESE